MLIIRLIGRLGGVGIADGNVYHLLLKMVFRNICANSSSKSLESGVRRGDNDLSVGLRGGRKMTSQVSQHSSKNLIKQYSYSLAMEASRR